MKHILRLTGLSLLLVTSIAMPMSKLFTKTLRTGIHTGTHISVGIGLFVLGYRHLADSMQDQEKRRILLERNGIKWTPPHPLHWANGPMLFAAGSMILGRTHPAVTRKLCSLPQKIYARFKKSNSQ